MGNKKVGFIGLGNMGKAVAARMIKRGFSLTVCGHKRIEPVEELKAMGATAVKTCKEVAQATDIIMTCVVDDAQTEDVIWGNDGLSMGLRRGSVVMLLSTLSRKFCRKAARKLSEKVVGLLDVPIAGVPPDAETGDLVLMVGGDEKLLAECRPALESFSKAIFHFGPVGAGQTAKCIIETLSLGNWFVANEGLNLGIKSGLDFDKLLQLVSISGAKSWMIEQWPHLSEVIKYCQANTEAASGLQIIYRDIDLILGLAKEFNVKMPITALTKKLNIMDMPTV